VDAFAAIKNKLKGLKGAETAAIVGDLADMEAMAALKDMMANLGSDRVECRQDGSHLEDGSRSGYIMNSGIAGVEDADYLLMVGVNPRLEAPILNSRIHKAVRHFGLKVGNIGSAEDVTYKVDEFGNDASQLDAILSGKHAASKALKAAKKPIILVGQAALSRTDGAAILKATRDIADKYCVSKDWNGFNVLHNAAGRVGGLDLGLTTKGGVDGIIADAESGKLKVVFLLGADEIDTSALKNTTVIYVGTHGDEGVKHADIILPAAAYTEKFGTYANTEGRFQRTEKATFAPGAAREDWTIFRALSEVLGDTLPYDSLPELRSRIAKEVHGFDQIDQIQAAEWADFGKKGKINSSGIAPAIENFYQTNPIARASQIMADCSEARSGSVEEATGTNG